MMNEKFAKASSSPSILLHLYLLVGLCILISATIAGTLIYGQVRAREVEQTAREYHLATRLDISRINSELDLMRQIIARMRTTGRGTEINHREQARSALIIDRRIRSVVATQRRFANPEFESATQGLAAVVKDFTQLMADASNQPTIDETLLEKMQLVQTRCIQLDRLHEGAVLEKRAIAESPSARTRFNVLLSILVVTGCFSILFALGLATRAIKRKEQAEIKLAHRAMEAEAIYQAIAMTNTTDSFEEALQECINIVCHMTGWPVGHAYVPSKGDPNRLEPTNIWHLPDEQRFAAIRNITEQTAFVIGEGLPGRILASGQATWIANVQEDENFPRNDIGRELGVKGAFGFPIKIAGKVAAILEFFTDREMEEDKPLLLMVRSVGEQVGRVVERKSAADKLRETHNRLTHVSRLSTMGEMVAGIAHEINQPLTAIANYALASKNTIAATNHEFDAPVEDWLQSIGEQAVRCGDIIRRLRNFVKKGDDDREWTDLNRVVLESVALIQNDIRHRSVVIDCQLPDTETLVHINRTQLQQVIVNLLKNAFDATTDAVAPKVSICVDRQNSFTRLTVEDNGRGVEESQRPMLFDTFFTTKPDGLGMGLAISKSIVEAHNGKLHFDPETTSGASFHIEFPTVPAPQESILNVG